MRPFSSLRTPSLALRHSGFVIALALAATASADSLWTAPGATERPLVGDRKAAATGDILTIAVSESATTTASQSKSTNSDSSVTGAVDQFIFAGSKLGTHNGQLPGIGFSGGSEYSGGGSVNSNQSITARAAVLVTDVLPNGVLVIEGVRRVTFAGETQHVVLRGLVRPDDISPANVVFSSNIADARLEFISEGSLTDAQKRGWLTRLYERLRPF